ncbi:MAG: hypothetical protein GF401_07520, partial [Chitinivibrionales bacterium]|nr:hypothetical protein [Chitinivibrionales bacterium]
MVTALNTSPVSIGNDVRYTGLFLFSSLPSFAAKRKPPAIQAPYLWLKRPPVQKPLPGDFGGELYHIKKEFDEEGGDDSIPGIGMYYFGLRFYDPEIGDFRSPDKVGQFFNSYQYTSRDPI